MLLVLIALVWLLMNSMLIAPLSLQKKILSDHLHSDRAQRLGMQETLQLQASKSPVDPDIAIRSRLKVFTDQLQHTSASLDAIQRELVSPDKMSGLLQDILRKNKQLKLISLKTVPVIAAAANAELAVYQHGVALKVQGRYLDLLSYLHTLEELPWHILWGNMSLVADVYPQSILTVTIYTVSLDQAWLSI